MKLYNSFKLFLKKLHRHKWNGTAWNCYRVAVEQKCKCGVYRHLDPEKFNINTECWKDGPSPAAQQLRDKGLNKHPNFSIPDHLWEI